MREQRNKWLWNPSTGYIGVIHLGMYFSEIPDSISLVKLKRFEEENYDTYEIKDANGSKVFVERGYVKAVMCGDKFFLGDQNLIGLTVYELKNLIPHDWELAGEGVYYNKALSITAYTIEEKIKWITVDSWDNNI
ncbi:MAG: hypothetical protein AAFP19_19410 [Bacteroidota bacterium]